MSYSHQEPLLRAVIHPDKLHRPSQVLDSIPADVKRGVYAWWFKNIPQDVPIGGTVVAKSRHLLYVGTGPVSPTSSATLRDRLAAHVTPDASRSTLRRSLGCVLGMSFEVKRLSKSRMHDGLGKDEERLSEWLEQNALISWVQHETPWELESYLIKKLVLPLNVDENERCEFACKLHERRKALFAKARLALNEK
jgi:hypothetical protein